MINDRLVEFEIQLTMWKLISCPYTVFVSWINHVYLLLRVSTQFMDARLWDRCGALWLSSETWADCLSLSSQLFHLCPQESTLRSSFLQVCARERLWYNDLFFLLPTHSLVNALVCTQKWHQIQERHVLVIIIYSKWWKKREMLRGKCYQELLNMCWE